jgi:hypothetical protein
MSDECLVRKRLLSFEARAIQGNVDFGLFYGNASLFIRNYSVSEHSFAFFNNA